MRHSARDKQDTYNTWHWIAEEGRRKHDRVQPTERPMPVMRTVGGEEAPLYPTSLQELQTWWDCIDWGGPRE